MARVQFHFCICYNYFWYMKIEKCCLHLPQSQMNRSKKQPNETNGRRKQCAQTFIMNQIEGVQPAKFWATHSTFTLTAVNCANKIIFQLALLVLSFFLLLVLRCAVLYRCYYFIDKIVQPMNVFARFASLLACNVWENCKLIDYNMQNKRNCGRPYASANLIDRLFSLLCHWKFNEKNEQKKKKWNKNESCQIWFI